MNYGTEEIGIGASVLPYTGSSFRAKPRQGFGGSVRGPSVSRIYEAAKYDRHTEGWFGDYGVSQWDITGQLQIVRNRSRELAKNDPHLQRFLWQRRNNIVGAQGFKLVMDIADWSYSKGMAVKRPDRMANGIIERGFERWAENPEWCDANGRKTAAEIIALLDRDYVREGECILQLVPGPQSNNPYNFSWLRMRPDQLAILYSAELPSGNTVYNGVEVSPDGRVSAYWFHSRLMPTGVWAGEKFRVPAELICHLYDEDYEGQHRGFPIIACVLRTVKLLHTYIDAEVIKANRQAFNVAHHEVDPAMYQYADPRELGMPEADEARDQLTREVQPGEEPIEPVGYRRVQEPPTSPNPVFPAFKQEMLRIISSGLGAAYHNLASDFASINWSAGRLAEGEQREGWKADQARIIDHILRPSFRRPRGWLAMWLTSGNAPLPFSKFSRFRECDVWRGKRWFPADPVNEIPMLETGVKRGWWADQDLAAEFGYGSFAENVEKTKEDNEVSKGTPIADRFEGKTSLAVKKADGKTEAPAKEGEEK